MKQSILLTFISVILFSVACNSNNQTAELESFKTATAEKEIISSMGEKKLVLLELFTSEG